MFFLQKEKLLHQQLSQKNRAKKLVFVLTTSTLLNVAREKGVKNLKYVKNIENAKNAKNSEYLEINLA